jgi:hypothetical protein
MAVRLLPLPDAPTNVTTSEKCIARDTPWRIAVEDFVEIRRSLIARSGEG